MSQGKNIVGGLMRTSSQVMLVEVEFTSGAPRVLSCFSVDYIADNTEWAVEETRQALRRREFSARRTNIVLAGGDIEHRLVQLPPLSPRELEAVVEREAATTHSAPMATSYTETGTIRQEGNEKRELLVVSAPMERVTEQLSFAKRLGMRPGVITTAPIALLHLCAPAVEEKGIMAFFHMSAKMGHIVIARELSYRYHRDFSLQEEGQDSLPTERSDSLPERVAFEINRTLLYVRHRFRGEAVEKVILVAPYPDQNTEDVGAKLRELNVNTGSVDLSSILNADALIEGGESLSAFAAPVGAACMEPEEKIINLIPKGLKKGKRKASALAMGAIALGMVLFSLAFAQQKLSQTLHNSQQMLQSLSQEKERVLHSLERTEDVIQQKGIHNSRLRFLQLVEKRGLYWAAVLRELSHAAPQGVVFSELKVTRKEGEWVLKLRGKSASVDTASGMKTLNRFYSVLNGSPLFRGVKVNPPRVDGGRGERQREASRAVEPASGNELLFELEISPAMKPLPLEARKERRR